MFSGFEWHLLPVLRQSWQTSEHQNHRGHLRTRKRLSATQTWESGMIREPSVCLDENAELFKLYPAGSISPAGVPWTEPAVGYTTSADGITWTVCQQPDYAGIEWWPFGSGIETLRVYKLDNTYMVLHAATIWVCVGLTTSIDGIMESQASDFLLLKVWWLWFELPIHNCTCGNNGWKVWYNGRIIT